MASTYLTRTNSSAGSGTKFTISTWLKRSSLSTGIPRIMEFYHSATYYISLRFRDDSDTALQFYSESNGSGFGLRTNQVFRDTSAWYHIVLAVDTTDATADDRMKMYINGEQVTSFASRTNPTSSVDLGYNTSSATNYVGRKWENSDYFNGLMAHFHFVDGTAYAASAFGETDATTGIWKPKTAPSVTYGTNGFFLKFENSGSMGTDSSGNANNFTVNGNLTQTVDTPSNLFATLNSLDFGGNSPTYSNGNLKYQTSGGGAGNNSGTRGTLGFSSGKYYWEAKALNTTTTALGIQSATIASVYASGGYSAEQSGFYGIRSDGGKFVAGSYTSSIFTAISANDILGFAIDCDNGKFYVSVNGTWVTSGDPTSGATGTGSLGDLVSGDSYLPACCNGNYNAASNLEYNFGNGYFGTTAVSSAQNPDDGIGIFEYDVPTGYRALCTKSINAEEYA